MIATALGILLLGCIIWLIKEAINAPELIERKAGTYYFKYKK
jgi:hypothetical protein